MRSKLPTFPRALVNGRSLGRGSVRTVQGKIWPNGEFSVGRGNSLVEREQFDLLAAILKKRPGFRFVSLPCVKGDELASQCNEPFTQETQMSLFDRDSSSPLDESHVNSVGMDSGEDSLESEPLGLSDVSISPTSFSERAKRGSKGMSSYSAKMVRSAAFLLEKEWSKRRLTFATLTLPPHESIDWLKLVEDWPSIIKQFIKEVGRVYERRSHGVRFRCVYCYEVQERRQQRLGGVPLHLHLVFGGRPKTESYSKAGWILRPKEIAALWRRALVNHGYPKECDWSGCERVERVVKSVSAYLAKYMSKGCSDSALTGFVLPSWSGMTDSLRKQVKRMTLSGSVALGHILDWIEFQDWAECGFEFLRPVSYQINGTKIPWGYSGRVSPDVYEYLTALTIAESRLESNLV